MNKPDDSSDSDGYFCDEESFLSMSQSQEEGEGEGTDLCSFDPTFASETEMGDYLRKIGQKDSVITSEKGN